ncbi:MAG: hypothetical protein M5R41_10200 [Bacteroidia bacterium]|nr:hypothetical protein [Bacteroidia bacterium]
MKTMPSFIRRVPAMLPALSVVLVIALIAVACSKDDESTAVSPGRSSAVVDPSVVVYGVTNYSNPFESVGLRHNDIVHAGLTGLLASDTVSSTAMVERMIERTREWVAFSSYDAALSDACIDQGIARDPAKDYRAVLAGLNNPEYTERENRFLRKLGKVLATRGTFAEVEKGLALLEMDILAEPWPADRNAESAPRIAIAVAKHSFAYWKRVLSLALSLDRNALGKTSNEPVDITIEDASPGQMIVAADVAGAITGAERYAGAGPEKQIIGAVIVGGTSSLFTAVIVHHKKIIGFFRRLVGCDR